MAFDYVYHYSYTLSLLRQSVIELEARAPHAQMTRKLRSELDAIVLKHYEHINGQLEQIEAGIAQVESGVAAEAAPTVTIEA